MQELDHLFRTERRRLWALSYRLTGSAMDADDIVQEAFVRAIERPPADTSLGLAGWLVRVTTNLSIDRLRRRKSARYPGEWLPAPVDTEDGLGVVLAGEEPTDVDPEGRYGLLESTSFAFLIALEALDPRQRAVLVLRDVLDYSAREVGAVLELGEENVRVIHHRARRSMEGYDAGRCIPDAQLEARTRAALERFMDCLARQDARGIEALLAEDVRTVTDSGGRFTALRTPLAGRKEVARLYLVAAQHRVQAGPSLAVRSINGLPALLLALKDPQRRQAPRTLLRCDVDESGRITHLHTILAPAKLAGIRGWPE